jgi:hypothetical protein
MKKFFDGDVDREINTADLIAEFQDEVLYLDRHELDEAEWQLLNSQYAYVKFGLILEKIRNQSWWRNCAEKFLDFRSFCQTKVNLNIWQAANAIKSAQVAVKLVFLGFTELPRNASQALKMADLSIERLGEVWGDVIKSCAAHKITAAAIESVINPDAQPLKSTLTIPTILLDQIVREAIERGLTVPQYLERLVNGEPIEADLPIPADPVSPDTDELVAILDRVELTWKQPPTRSISPQKIIETAIDKFDDLMTDLIGQYLPIRAVKTG